ncbi:hypothetical protein D3C87_2120040 [compost metagenome]
MCHLLIMRGCVHPTTRHGELGAAVLVVLATGDKTGKKCPAHLPLRGRQACCGDSWGC